MKVTRSRSGRAVRHITDKERAEFAVMVRGATPAEFDVVAAELLVLVNRIRLEVVAYRGGLVDAAEALKWVARAVDRVMERIGGE